MCNLYVPRVRDQIITNMKFVKKFLQNILLTVNESDIAVCMYVLLI